ncbi:MAG: dihydrodipicolinate synthase family protein [Gemmatimonadetes bacterium]|nr:dihydrodipicolinate synthase family protein [Gemmatimonadota bacterium]MBT6144579.1 dihydrodipicolinate synthase family protein [Gemmatimonadota bacterium]MBT7860592.1 dihydrodipicolinate synthase family protein [Gemmatimonadota bacterium]
MSPRLLSAADCADVLVVAITPRRADGQVDLEGVRRNVEFLCEQGVRFLMPMCGTGLVYDATLAEFEAVTQAFLEAAGDRALVVPGIGPGFGRSLEMAKIARGLGVAGAMIMPIVGPASAAGVRAGLSRIASEGGLPIVLYQRRLDIMPVDDVVDLCGHESVVGLKYAVDDIESFRRIAGGAGDRAAMVCGMAEDPCLDYLRAGAVGFSSGMANFAPRMSLSILSSYQAGNESEAERLRSLMVPFEDFRGENSARYSGSALHTAMEEVGLAGGPVVPFIEDVASEDLPRVRELMNPLKAEEAKLVEAAS